jgi:cytidine deaminase
VDDDGLIRAAWTARDRAYAPYSRFLVGAAVLTSGGVFTGCNVENAAYSVGICAERTAAAAAVAAGQQHFLAVAVVSSAPSPATPCGVCRQFLFEFSPEMTVLSEGMDGSRRSWKLSELLVEGFGPSDLAEAGSASPAAE